MHLCIRVVLSGETRYYYHSEGLDKPKAKIEPYRNIAKTFEFNQAMGLTV